MAISKVTTASITDADITTAKLAYDAAPFRNIIINGDMSIAQRSTSSETVTGSGGLYYHTVDRFGMNIHSDFNNKSTMAQNLDSLTAPDYFDDYVGLQIDTATTPSGDVYYNFRQQIEGNNIGYLKFGTSSAKTITISFWVRSTLTGNFSFSLRNANSDRSFVTTYNIATANTWEKKTITITGDTTGTWTSTNAVGLTANWGLGNSTGTFSTSTLNSWQGANKTGATSGVDLVATANAKWYITGIQIEAGDTASDFEFLPVDVNLARCQRYFWSPTTGTSGNGSVGVGGFFNTTQGDFLVSFPTAMRGTYSLGYSALSDIRVTSHTAAYDASAIALNASVALTSSVVRITSGTALATAGNYGYFFLKNTSARLNFDAEL